jgi:dTDP-4-dehydrorhamnose reductase
MDALELWGGIECTVNRVGDSFHNQLQRSGHDRRPFDLDRIAELGIRRLRYPALWELTAPHAPNDLDWRWTDERLKHLRELGIEPIIGLMHHGSGPRYTNLLDDRFPELFAAYAGAVATRYPWVRAYTPINEPLTTARFSALYGHWYPHRRDDRSFVRALVNQCRATILAMQEIRSVNPSAQLIQTDDVGYTRCTAKLASQASFDNERRWLSWDLLCGRIDAQHPLWKYLCDCGFGAAEAEFFREHRCPPDIIGVNHYITSDRYLSEHQYLFPPNTWGGNGEYRYADVEAVRALPLGGSGLAAALHDAWTRYRLPLAVTEVHIGCTREEQLRWLWQAWKTGRQLRAGGMDLRAVTAWALFGSFDWNSLLTANAGDYEAGAFDVRHPTPRRTALAKLIGAVATGTEFHPAAVLEQPGWWQRADRLYVSVSSTVEDIRPADRLRSPLLIIGAADAARLQFERVCGIRGLRTQILDCVSAEARSIELTIKNLRPWGLVAISDARNNLGSLANACAQHCIPILTFPSLSATNSDQTSRLVHAALDALIDGDARDWDELARPYLAIDTHQSERTFALITGLARFEPPIEPASLPLS